MFMVDANLNPKAQMDDSKESGDGDVYSDCKVIMKKVSEFLSPALRSIRTDAQNHIDNELIKMYNDLQDESNAYHLIPAISTLITQTTANALRLPMYKYLNRTRQRIIAQHKGTSFDDDDDADSMDLKLPNLLVQITRSSSNRDPAIHIVPKPTLKVMDRIKTINEIATAILEVVPSSKLSTSKSLRSTKSDCILIEDTDCNDLEGLLTLIGTVISKKEVSLCLSFSENPSSLHYDSENGKYRVNGTECDNEAVIAFFEKLVEKHPEIEYLEDPLHETDVETTTLLTAKMRTKKVKVIGNVLYNDDNELIHSVSNGMQSERTSAVMVSTSGLFTMSSALKIANMMEPYEAKAELMVSDNDFVPNGIASHTVDLAVACGATLVRLPLPNVGGQATAMQYNRWLMIADELAVDMEDVNEDEVEEQNVPKMNGVPTQTDMPEVELANGSAVNAVEKTEDLP